MLILSFAGLQCCVQVGWQELASLKIGAYHQSFRIFSTSADGTYRMAVVAALPQKISRSNAGVGS